MTQLVVSFERPVLTLLFLTFFVETGGMDTDGREPRHRVAVQYLTAFLVESGARLKRVEEGGASLNRAHLANAPVRPGWFACHQGRSQTQSQSPLRPRAGLFSKQLVTAVNRQR
jgi:hypothetical protein